MAKTKKKNGVELGQIKYSVQFLKSVTEEKAIQSMPGRDRNQVINAWKQANGLSVRNHEKENNDK